MVKLSFLLITSILFTSCAGIIPGRTFIDEMERDSDGMWVPGQDFALTAGDHGEAYRPNEEIRSRTPASQYERQQALQDRSVEMELKQKVNALDEMAYAQFQRDRRFLATTSEQIYYLDLTPSERASYVALKQGGAQATGDQPYAYLGNYRTKDDFSLRSYFNSRYEERALHLGMTKGDVVSSWGEPQGVDFAGDPRMQNERWSFYSQGKTHYVYFEGGRVQGWNLQ